MGAVYRAQDLNLGRAVALKVMHGQLARQSQFQQRFIQEAQSVARLKHPSIVTIYSFGSQPDLLFIDMELVPGLTLGHHFQRMIERGEVVRLTETLHLIAQVAEALGYAHRHLVIHRDIKPGNILVRHLEEAEREDQPPLRAVVTDFGLAKLQGGSVQTDPGALMGTLPYMPPEQLIGQPVDGRTDLYSLGIVLYQLATGQLPYEIHSINDAVEKHLRSQPPRPHIIQPGLPESVSQVVLKAMAKRPEDRYQTGEEMARALREVRSGMSRDEETQFLTASHTAVVSLVTQLELPPSLIQLPSQMVLPGGGGSGGRLVISQKGESPYEVPLSREVLTLGRDQSNDVVLDARGISRQHARIRRVAGGWEVTDLKSTNGTFLGEDKLLPDVPQTWNPAHALRIGPIFLRLERGEQDVPGTAPLVAATSVLQVPAGATQVFSDSGLLGMVINPTNLDVEPGKNAEMEVQVANDGSQVDHLTLHLDGLPASWVTMPVESRQLMPNATGRWSVFIHPPRESGATAGDHPFRLGVTSEATGRDTAAVSGSVTVRAFEQTRVEMQPQILSGGGRTTVTIANQGNAAQTYRLAGRDPEDALKFKLAQTAVNVGAGETSSTALQVRKGSRIWMGSARDYPFEVAVQPERATAQVMRGQYQAKALIPVWLLPALLFVCLALSFAGWRYMTSVNVNATATAVAIAVAGTETAAAAGTVDSDGDGIKDVDEAKYNADPQNRDTDGDGLDDGTEVELSTRPDIADSDDDGLNDFEEVRVYQTNALNPDMDRDGLSDGDEINVYGTFPDRPDTDGDGAGDGEEVQNGTDPGRMPTLTPTPIPTSTSTPTMLPSTLTPTAIPTTTPTQVIPTATPTASPSPDATQPQLITIGRSVLNAPIEAVRFGDGSRAVVFIGGLHAGFAPSTVDIAAQAIDYFTANLDDIPSSISLYIIENANPDSRRSPGNLSGRLNANDVDLNRNWGCDWTRDATFRGDVVADSGGSQAFSEPETQALRDFILGVDPEAIVFWEARATNGLSAPGFCGAAPRVSQPLASAYGNAAGYDIGTYEAASGTILNGDGTNWLDGEGFAAIAVLIKSYESVDWSSNLSGMLAVLDMVG